MKNIIAIALLTATLGFSQSIERQVISNGGETLSDGATVSMDFTVGELVVTTISDGTTTLTQGFHQANLRLAIKLHPKAYLEGAALNPNTGEEALMRDDLRVGDLVPTTSPYTDALTCDTSVLTVTGANAIVDWVWVELRDGADNTTVVGSQSALLQRDGDVVGVDGVSELSFTNLANGNYHVSVNHRNHLGIITATPIALSGTLATVDFTTSEGYSLGGSLAVTLLANGLYGMYGGDFNGDGQVLNTDIQSVIPLAGLPGYSSADADLNGQILNTDIQNVMRPNAGKGQQYSN